MRAGSHKANFVHPLLGRSGGSNTNLGQMSVDEVPEAVEVFMDAGDVLLFTDAIAHGAARRTNPGQRRVCVYRYGPAWGNFRFGYRPSTGLLERLSLRRRRIVAPALNDRLLRPQDEPERQLLRR